MYSSALTIKKQTILMLITTLPLLMSDGMIELIGLSNNLVILIRLFVGIFIALLCIQRKHLPSPAMCLIYLIYGTIICSSRFHGNLMTSISSLINSLIFCIAFDYWLSCKYEVFLLYMRKILWLFIVSNFITVLVFKDGLYGTQIYAVNWLLGHKNSHMTYIMMAVIIESIVSYKMYYKIRFTSLLYMILCCISLYIVDAATAFIIVTIYVAFLVVFVNYCENKYVKLILNIFSVRTIIIITLIITTIVVFLQDMDFVANTFSGIFDSMNRDTSFTGRTVIWSKSIEIIQQNLWFGQGVVDSVLYGNLTGLEAGTHAHNYILNILVMGGIVCLVENIILYIYILWCISYRKSFFSYSLGLAIGLYFISGLTGVNFYSALYNPLFILTEYVLANEHKQNNLKREIGRK